MKTKRHAFFFHYNRPASLKAGHPVISLHYRRRCMLVHNLVCEVPTRGRCRKTQPRFVIQGWAEEVTIKEAVAYIR